MNTAPDSTNRALHAAVLVAMLCSTCACGLKGPLYMPDSKPDMVEVKVPPGVPTPSTQKKERSSDSSKQSGGSNQPTTTPPR